MKNIHVFRLCQDRLGQVTRPNLLDINFRDSPDSLNGLGIPGNIWFRRFAVTYTHSDYKNKSLSFCIKMGKKISTFKKLSATEKAQPSCQETINLKRYNPYFVEEYSLKVVISEKGANSDHSYLASVINNCVQKFQLNIL